MEYLAQAPDGLPAPSSTVLVMKEFVSQIGRDTVISFLGWIYVLLWMCVYF
jgi:hypothetical protein